MTIPPRGTQALLEAQARASAEHVILATVELRHPAIVDDEGEPMAVRLVHDEGNLIEDGDPPIFGWQFGLEDDAPLDAGETVTFIACAFDVAVPDGTEGAPPRPTMSIDNVANDIRRHVEATLGTRAAIEVTYREYLLAEPGAPQRVQTGFTLPEVLVTHWRATGVLRLVDALDRVYPGVVYDTRRFPALRGL